jgi:[citrate (pro-3S)-lyase] ligase
MLWSSAEAHTVDLGNPREVQEVRQFLQGFDLAYNGDVDYTVAFYDERLQIIATGSLKNNVLCNIAVAESLQGEGFTASVVSHLMREAATHGLYHYFLFTKPDMVPQFSSLCFKEIARSDSLAVLLESGIGSIGSFLHSIANETVNLPVGRRAALVVNCNPFTLGHEAVIARASRENDAVIVLVVSEDQSAFPFAVRFRLVQEGLKKYPNVCVLPSGPYIISAATFPGYFTKGQDTVAAQTRLDATIFGQWIAPALGVTRRYVGDEPYSEVTRQYNEALLEVLPQYGIEVVIMPRKQAGTEIISASRVRQCINKDEWQTIRRMVPETTYAYLVSSEAQIVLQKLRTMGNIYHRNV